MRHLCGDLAKRGHLLGCHELLLELFQFRDIPHHMNRTDKLTDRIEK